MSTPATGFRNLGASCFVNAGLQLVFAVPGFVEAVANGHSETEKAVKAAAELLIHHPRSSSVPTSVTDTFYHGVQEDMAEFVVRLLDSCQSTHAMMRGQETAKLRCRHCGFSRSLPPEAFLTLQVPLTTTTSSVQQALDNYLATECVQANVEEWFCVNDVCLDSGIAEEDPLHVTSINKWPDVLLLCVKRWDALRGLIAQQIHCSKTLSAGGNEYSLQALATHIGATPSSGHYMAYQRRGAGFVQLNDHMVSPLKTQDEDFFVTMPDEKVYMLAYVKTSAGTSTAPVAMPKFNFKRKAQTAAIDLDSSPSSIVQDTDFDVIAVQHVASNEPGAETSSPPVQKTRPTSINLDDSSSSHDTATGAKRKLPPGLAENQKPAAKSRRPLANFSEAERLEIAQVIRDSSSVAEAVSTLSKTAPKLTVKDKASPTYLSRHTLRNWWRKHSSLDRAMTSSSPGKSKQVKMRSSRAGSVRDSLSLEARVQIASALRTGQSTSELVDNLSRTLPGFSCTDKDAVHYIPRGTLHRWQTEKASAAWFANASSTEPTSWNEEHKQTFAIAFVKPGKRSPSIVPEDDANGLWLLNGAWTFCPACGRRRARSSPPTLSASCVYNPAVICYLGCDTDAKDLLAPPQTNVTRVKLEGYVTPLAQHWQPWVDYIGSGQLPLSTLLSQGELEGLAVLDIKVDFRSRRGGNAEILSKQKRTVVRCRWRPTSLATVERSDQAARAFTWLLTHNVTYASFVERHERLIRDGIHEDHAWREIPTAELLLNSPGIEVAARPWLYPLASFGDGDLKHRLVPLGWLDSKSNPSSRTSFLRKLTSRCIDYSRDFPL